MGNLLKASLLAMALLTNAAIACDIHGQTGFLPKNNLYIPVGEKAAGGITEVQFNRVMDKMVKLYTDPVKNIGRKLEIERRWSDGTVNAYAEQNTPGVNRIVMFGGLARSSETTEDAMALVACHELGHHMGGAPRKIDPSTNSPMWASNEGQADYWGTMKCLRHYFGNDNNSAIVKKMKIPAEVTKSCNLVYKNANEVASCQRASMAGLALGRLLNSLSQGPKTDISFITPDQSVVTKMFDSHPKAQCRLDTYYQGALCDHGFEEVVSETDANVGVCTKINGDTIGNRPTCWFKE